MVHELKLSVSLSVSLSLPSPCLSHPVSQALNCRPVPNSAAEDYGTPRAGVSSLARGSCLELHCHSPSCLVYLSMRLQNNIIFLTTITLLMILHECICIRDISESFTALSL